MAQLAVNTSSFHLKRSAYWRAMVLGVLILSSLFLCCILALGTSLWLWRTYAHNFTPYLKWQDALVALLSFIAFLSLGGKILVARFLYAVHCGYTRGMVTLTGSNALTVCDLSPLNLASVFWMMHSSFWCFVAALLGLSPAILIGWTVHLAHPVWSVVATGVAILLSIAGLVVSVVALVFILVGCFGAVSFTRKLGAPQLYQLSHQTVLRIDDFVLTIIHPGAPETMVDLSLLAKDDQHKLLALLHDHWINAEQVWNPTLGEEIAAALREAEERSLVLV
ncbi:MAG: hypothetical protein E6J34_06275 [Chloroflexi bacterium]|nr:MAG: hypothetical protein E6J34_06275 [Chloroflexota bacterium]